MDDKIIIGIISAIGGGIFALLTTYITGRFKMRELEFQKLLHYSRARLSAAHSKLDEVYIPIMSHVEKCYRAWYLFKVSQNETNKETFFNEVEGLRGKYEELVDDGRVVFLVPQAREELERLVRFLERSKNATQWNILLLKRIEGIGIRSVTETTLSKNKIIFAYINILISQVLFKCSRWFSVVIQSSCEIRTESAPIDSNSFAEEFHKIVDVLRTNVADVALYDSSSASDANGH